MAVQFTPDSCPIPTRITHLHTVSHLSHILVVLLGPAEGHWCSQKGRAFGEVWGLWICLVCPATYRYCLPTASRRRLLKVPPIQQYCELFANHTLESYPRIIHTQLGWRPSLLGSLKFFSLSQVGNSQVGGPHCWSINLSHILCVKKCRLDRHKNYAAWGEAQKIST